MSIGKRNPIVQEENGFYRTPYWVTDALLRVEPFGRDVWEPACGEGDISDVLKHYGHHVASSDLIDRGYGSPITHDFLKLAPFWNKDAIITNPPYRLAEEFLHKAFEHKPKKVAFMLRLSFLAGEKRRHSLFGPRPPNRVWVISSRPTLWHGGDPNARTTGGAIDYAWYVWEPSAGKVTETTVGWVGRPSNLALAMQANGKARTRLETACTAIARGEFEAWRDDPDYIPF